MRFSIQHTTRYCYDAPLEGECYMEARLCPLSVPGQQRCQDFSLTTDPAVSIFTYDQAGQMGAVHHFTVRHDPHDTLAIHAKSTVETLQPNPFADINFLEKDWGLLQSPAVLIERTEWLAPTDLVPLGDIWPEAPGAGESVFAFAQAVCAAISTQFAYVAGATDVSTPLADFVAQRRGVCQDYAHLMLAACRRQGVPARYVSGYVYAGDDAVPHGAGATHAWVEVFLPHNGLWKGFDPTNNIMAGETHVKVAVGRDYADVPPTKGLLRADGGRRLPAQIELDVTVNMERLA